jgi:hypothetical protein
VVIEKEDRLDDKTVLEVDDLIVNLLGFDLFDSANTVADGEAAALLYKMLSSA